MDSKKLEERTRAYALKNAVSHEGKAMMGPVVSSLFVEGLKKEDMKKYSKKISEIILEVNKLGLEKQNQEFEKIKESLSEREEREGLPELPNVKKSGVIMRFAPAPSGPLHIGHVIAAIPSYLYFKKYGGKFYVRIEDTNPEKTMKECYKLFKEDCDWLFKKEISEYIIQSERMEVYYKYAEKFIQKGAAYVCTCSSEKFKEFSELKEDCPCRNNELKENLMRWKKMLDKKGYNEGDAVLRFKSNMQDPNPAMRDFPLARINEHEHPLQKHKYRVWPLMMLSVTVDDIEYSMTHIIRGKDHRDNAKKQQLMYSALGLDKKFPEVIFVGRVKFTDIELSKRKIVAAIEKGEFEGWDDEKLPTIISLRKRGYLPEAFYKLAERRGISEVDKLISQKDFFELLNQINDEEKNKTFK